MTPLGPSEHRALDAAGRAVSAAVTHTGGSSEDEARFARGRGLLRTWAATAAERRADRPRGAALGAMGRGERGAGSAGRGVGRGALGAVDRGGVAGRRTRGARPRAGRGVGVGAVGRGRVRVVRGGPTGPDGRAGSSTRRSGCGRRCRRALPAALLDRRPFRPGAFFGKVGALEREIGRTRGGLSVRRLVEQYGEVIGAITPCVLVSPDSLARFVPPGSMSFDLVVFDEASQITVADAVGALGRADAAVIAGDSKQMPPSVFAELSMDDAGRGGGGVPGGPGRGEHPHRGRARGRRAALAVVALPQPGRVAHRVLQRGVLREPAVQLPRPSRAVPRHRRLASRGSPGRSCGRRVAPGSTRGRCGRIRSRRQRSSTEVLRRWQARERSIGVVTFNIQQRALIESMLEESGVDGLAEALAAKRDGLFVKNLENVQGDERDVILFSTGFSANANGVLPLNFGPLNRSGGERRLNVAVTRARRRVMVFSSFEPEDLRVEQTSSVGIRDLRRYLEVAKYGVATTPAASGRRRSASTGTVTTSLRRCGRPGWTWRRRWGCRSSRSTSPSRPAASRWRWRFCWTPPRGPSGGRRRTATRCRSSSWNGSWAGPRWFASGCRTGSRTATRSWRGSSSPLGRRRRPLVGSGSES